MKNKINVIPRSLGKNNTSTTFLPPNSDRWLSVVVILITNCIAKNWRFKLAGLSQILVIKRLLVTERMDNCPIVLTAVILLPKTGILDGKKLLKIQNWKQFLMKTHAKL